MTERRTVVVIGGGAAGLMAAATAAEFSDPAETRVLLVEQNDRMGKKLRITGKGRCNLTNDCDNEEFLQNVPTNPRFLYAALSAFDTQDTKAYFEALGVPLKVERGKRVFPVSDKAADVVEALVRHIRELGVQIEYGRVSAILTEETDGGKPTVRGVRVGGKEIAADAVILCTGGCSYPVTGSDGNGYRLAERLGHTVIQPRPSLVPLVCAGDICGRMMGLSLRNVRLKVVDTRKGKCVYEDFGEMLFTHFGVSGPMVLSASAHIGKGEGWKISLDLKPALEEHKLDDRILRDLDMYQNRSMENALTDLLPRSMIPVVLRRIGVDGSLQANSFTKQNRRALVELLKNFTLEITGKRPVAEAIITSGGVKCGEIDPKTMQSKKVPGLYFAGEIIDCDAYTGGFNLQIAWATGVAAGKAASE